jgi:hypothetical protein
VAQTSAPLSLRERIETDRARAKPARRRWTLGGSLAGAIGALARSRSCSRPAAGARG